MVGGCRGQNPEKTSRSQEEVQAGGSGEAFKVSSRWHDVTPDGYLYKGTGACGWHTAHRTREQKRKRSQLMETVNLAIDDFLRRASIMPGVSRTFFI